ADDVGVEAFGCYGGESYETPRIDAMAAMGVRFENCHSQPLCTPSRLKIMTGLSNSRNYTKFSIMRPGEYTFAHMLRERGYATAAVGKWQLLGAEGYVGVEGTGTYPADAGFDQYCMWQITQVYCRYWNPLIDTDGDLKTHGEDVYGPDVFLDYAVEFMRSNRDRPFFLYYPMALPHNPFETTPLSLDRSLENGPGNFGDMVRYIDRQIGRLQNALTELGLDENTVLIFTSDNGTNGQITSRQNGRDVRGAKSQTLDTGTHVPLVVTGPGVAPGVVVSDLVDFSDFMPTLADISGTQSERMTDGVSFWPQSQGEKGTPREFIYTYYNPRPGNARFPETDWVRTVRYKLYGDGRLFDVLADPLEESPLKDDKVRTKLQSALNSSPRRKQNVSTPWYCGTSVAGQVSCPARAVLENRTTTRASFASHKFNPKASSS
ncbi:MAG: sulfatase-like hydrolase/transferase, partial [Armatimonadetes bacterium]|nr:sulfatase-like hydrolase/transferase [Armatimonadota bacterium]